MNRMLFLVAALMTGLVAPGRALDVDAPAAPAAMLPILAPLDAPLPLSVTPLSAASAPERAPSAAATAAVPVEPEAAASAVSPETAGAAPASAAGALSLPRAPEPGAADDGVDALDASGRRMFDTEDGTRDSVPDAVAAPPQTDREIVMARFATVPPAQRSRLGRYLGQAFDLISGKGGMSVGKGATAVKHTALVRSETYEPSPTPPAASPEEKKLRPLVEETRRLLSDSEGPNGFNSFLIDFTLEAYLDLQDTGKIRSEPRKVQIHARRSSDPSVKGWDDVVSEDVLIRDLPIVSEEDFLRVIDRRLGRYGFPRDLMIAPSSEEDRQRYYARVLQLLYLADRLSHPKLNSLGADMLRPFMAARAALKDDFLTNTSVRRSPENVEHIHNLLRMLCQFDCRLPERSGS